jgi:hypothetical protein
MRLRFVVVGDTAKRCCLRTDMDFRRTCMTTAPDPDHTSTSLAADRDGHASAGSDARHLSHDLQHLGGVDLGAVIAEVRNLRAQLQTLPVIEQAKGILIGRYQIEADAAFALLQRWSSHTNVKLREISRLVVEAAGQPAAGSSADRGASGPVELDRLIAALSAGSIPEDLIDAPTRREHDR